MRFGGVAAAGLALILASGPPGMAEAASRQLSFKDLKGWARDDQSAALAVFRKSCGAMAGAAWAAICGRAKYVAPEDARIFFEQNFQPVLIDGARPTLFTGYYEPEIPASPVRTPNFAYPIYRKPPELKPGMVWYDRATIENRGLLRGRGLEIAWLPDPVDVFFLQVQGSGRLLMPDGTTMRVGFSAKNGQPYRSVGMELVRRGIYTRGQASAQGIRAWVQAHPVKGPELLQHNPSFIFFRKLHLPQDTGPIGAMALPVTPGRT
ncbi:murein transglycosylase, partial [Thioclava sp. BHET1]